MFTRRSAALFAPSLSRIAAAWLCDPADCQLNLLGSPCLGAMSPSQHLNLAGWKRFRHCPAMCCHSQLSSLRDSKEVFGPGVNFWGHHKSGEDIWKLTQLKSEVLFWLSTCLFAPLLLCQPVSDQLQIPNCALQTILPPDLHATMIKICCLIPDFYNEPEILYRMLNFWLTWYEAMQWHRHRHTHPQSRGSKQQQLFSWHRAGALWFLEQVDYLTSSR